MEQLPQDIHKRISEFVLPQEALNFSSTSKQINDNVDLAIFNDTFSHNSNSNNNNNNNDNNKLRDMHWIGLHRNDPERIWFRFMPFILGGDSDKIHTIQFTCQFKDQGWGNRKSKLFIREDKNPTNHQGDIVAETPIAEHHRTNVFLEFHPKAGKNYTMCLVVGGGGGHELFVYNPKIVMLVYGKKLANAASRFQKYSLVPLLENSFGAGLMRSSIDMLIRNLDRGEKQDESLNQCFTDIGIDTMDVEVLRRMRDFLGIYFDFQSSLSSSQSGVVDEELDSDGSDYVFEGSDNDFENSSASSQSYDGEMGEET